MLADQVTERLKARAPALQGRVEGAQSLAQLIAENRLPQHSPAAHVVPGGLRGGQADVSTGLFRQGVELTVSVLLTFRAVQGAGARAQGSVEAVAREVVVALCGWAPELGFLGEDAPLGVFRLAAAQVRNLAGGSLTFQIDFAIGDQLRIPT